MFKGGFKEAVRRDPLVRLFRHLTSSPDPAEWNARQGQKLMDFRSRRFDYPMALEHLKLAVKQAPDNALFRANLAEALLSAPSMAIFRGARPDFALRRSAELAASEAQKAIRLAPKFVWPYYLLAVCYEYLGQREKAVATVKQVLAQDLPPEARQMFETYSRALESAGQNVDPETRKRLEEETLEHIREAMRLRDAGKYTAAQKELEAAGKVSPDSAWMYDTLCVLGSDEH